MKKITVKWFPTSNNDLFDKEMRIIYSDDESLTEGTRFDFGKIQSASNEGYIIEIFP